MSMDYALKPSLARYEFREDVPFVPALATAKDSDETLLAMVQQQADVAAGYLRSGDPRKAIATLRRAFKLAAGHGGAEAEGGSIPVARRLAIASIRLQLCALLSRLGRHSQALVEARAAKSETDEVWHTALSGCSELVEAAEEGSLSKPAAPLRRLLLRPPHWLQDVVEASVQARQCIAVELEFALPGPIGERAPTTPSQADDSPGSAHEQGKAGVEGTPSEEEEARAMHREAVMLARQLLPEEHPTRDGAERAMLQAELRRQESRDREERRLAPALSSLSPAASAAELLLRRGRNRAVRPAALDASLGETTASKLLSALDGNMGFLNRRSSLLDGDGPEAPMTHESLFSPPGDVFNRSFQRSALKRRKKKTVEDPPPEQLASTTTVTTTAGSSSAPRARSESVVSMAGGNPKPKPAGIGPGAPRERDPFRAWKLEAMDFNKMTMKEIKSRSFEGIRELQADIKRDNRRFRNLWLREMDSDLLYEDRTLYTPHGMLASETAERKYEAWKKKAYKPTEFSLKKKEDQKKLFAFYGVPYSSSEPDLKAWGRVLRESHARTPAERQRIRKELLEARWREEEARHRREEEERAALQEKVDGFNGISTQQRRDSTA